MQLVLDVLSVIVGIGCFVLREWFEVDLDYLFVLLYFYFGDLFSVLCWCWMVLGVYCIRVEYMFLLIMLKIVLGKCLLMYSYGCSELIQILWGLYNDVFGLFVLGDVVDLDEEVEY